LQQRSVVDEVAVTLVCPRRISGSTRRGQTRVTFALVEWNYLLSVFSSIVGHSLGIYIYHYHHHHHHHQIA